MEQWVGLGGHEHRRVADRLDQAHRGARRAVDAALELSDHATQLVGRDLLAELGEADDVHEAHHQLLGARKPAALELGLADHRLADLLAHAHVEHVLERGARQRTEAAQRLRVAQAKVALGVAGLDQGLAERGDQGRGHRSPSPGSSRG